MENIFNCNFENICVEHGISNKLLDVIKNIDFTHPCTDFPKMFLMKLFIRMKIFYTIKYTNRDLVFNKKDKHIRKVKILSHV